MLQNLLTERFGLILHHEPREYSVYPLQVADGGSKIAKYASSRKAGGEIEYGVKNGIARVEVRSDTTEGLAKTLETQLVLPVIDRTGLTDSYDFTLEFASEGGVSSAIDLPAPSIFTAVRDQLGLILVKMKDTLDTLVIDSLAKAPSEN